MGASENNYTWGFWGGVGAADGFQGNPAAASLGVGHIDVFGRGPNNELEDKWFANGSWHAGWDDLQTPSPTVTLTSSPAVTSPGSGLLDVFARGSDGGIWHIGFSSTSWGGWSHIDCCLAGDVTNSVAVVSPSASTLNVFAILTDEALYGRGYSYATNSWGPWQPVAPTANANVAAAVWTLPPPPPLPTPTPQGATPTPRGGCFVSCPG